MPPVGNVTCQPNNETTADPSNIGKDDLNALLYIVVTLLFYSMGIIIGIITYLKREQAEMEEDKMFDMYMQLKREPFNLYKKERVQQMALYLKQLEEQAAAREKIENWKTIEHSQLQAHIQRYQSCRRHPHRNFTCPDCNRTSPIAEICQGYDERGALTISESGWPESGGGTALLCSLTLGVCEPLLTPESMKRLPLPDLTNMESKSLTSGPQGASLLQSCVPNKGAFRHTSLTVHYADNHQTMSGEECANKNYGTEFEQPLVTVPLEETDIHYPPMFEKGDIELKELRQFNYEEVKAVFQTNNAVKEPNHNVCDTMSFNPQTIPSVSKRRSSLTNTSGKHPMLFRQLSHDLGRKTCDLAVHFTFERSFNVNAEKNNENTHAPHVYPLGEVGLLMSPEVSKNATEVERLEENKRPGGAADSHECDCVRQAQWDQQVQCQEQYSPSQGQGVKNTSSPVATPPTTGWCTPQKYELPLHLFILAQQQAQPVDVKPKVYFPIPSIPHSFIRDEAGNMSANSPTSGSPQTPQRDHNPICETSKKASPQSVDMSDVTRARKLGLNWKSKAVDKKSTPRSQPERRGALFFTQRSLQKDLDSPKSASGRKYSKPALFSRQESLDSHNSRTSEVSESIDTPLLNQSSDVDNGLNLSSPSSSVGSNSMSPPTTSKHTKRIPRLIRSQTVDTSKLLQQ